MSAFTQELDARGLNCPLPILRTKKAMNGLASGDILKVVSTDKGSAQDIPAFCKQTMNWSNPTKLMVNILFSLRNCEPNSG